MHRLALAFSAALAFHVSLLMLIVPEQHVEEPEIKGTGQVTVSIVRSSPSVAEEDAEEIDLEPEPEEFVEPKKEDISEIEEEMTPVQEIKPVSPEPVVEERVIPKTTVSPVPENEEVSESEAQEVFKTEPASETVQAEEPSAFSDEEALQDPEPVTHLNHPPEYPTLARKRGWQGTVVLEVDIQSDGMVKNIQVKQSSSYALLDKEAMRAVKLWKFRPGSRAGKPVEMKALVPVHFVLQGQ